MTVPVIGLLLTATGVLVWPDGPTALAGGAGSAGRLGSAGRPGSAGPANGSRASTSTARAMLRRLGPAAGIALATTLVAPGLWWAGVSAAVVLSLFRGRRPPKPAAGQLRDRRRQLAGRLDLVAACLGSGLPVATAMGAVTQACGSIPPGGAAPGSPVAVRHPVAVLEEVAALLAVGADPAAAWASAAAHLDLASIAAAACRSATGGSALAAAFTEQAELLRRQNSDAAAAAAGRAGVMMTAPLGACFLPAFLCLGLAPAVIGLLGTLRLW